MDAYACTTTIIDFVRPSTLFLVVRLEPSAQKALQHVNRLYQMNGFGDEGLVLTCMLRNGVELSQG